MTSGFFNSQFQTHSNWRDEYAGKLKELSDWLRHSGLMDLAVQERLQEIEKQLRNDKIMMAFVAEFSRGKSELINAIFFARYGKRIMPASAGRTTMCPTELGWDASVPPCLRLLPIETRLEPQLLNEWRLAPDTWVRVDLDVNNGDQISEAFEKVSEINLVNVERARALGFWSDEDTENNPRQNADGKVEVPRWRHALINIDHPLLKKGLVILDTPGLNAIGAEPELTVSLIPQAQAVLFILGADTGVTKSDLAIWKEHLSSGSYGTASHLVVLNKIDGLWDELSSEQEIDRQIANQCTDVANILELTPDQVLPVSAQKGLLGKVQGKNDLLQRSRLPALEKALAESVLGKRQSILSGNVNDMAEKLRKDVERMLRAARQDTQEQLQELSGLRGKNTNVIKHMKMRISNEQADFSSSTARIHALKSIHMKLLRQVFDVLSVRTINAELKGFSSAIKQPGIKLGVKDIYNDTFARMQASLDQAKAINSEVYELMASSFKQLNTEFGFNLQLDDAPILGQYANDLENLKKNHLQYLSIGNTIRLARPEFADRLVKALSSRLRTIFDAALHAVEIWNKAAAAQIDAQVREHRASFKKRLEAIERIQVAAGSLETRITEIQEQIDSYDSLAETFSSSLEDLRSTSAASSITKQLSQAQA